MIPGIILGILRIGILAGMILGTIPGIALGITQVGAGAGMTRTAGEDIMDTTVMDITDMDMDITGMEVIITDLPGINIPAEEVRTVVLEEVM